MLTFVLPYVLTRPPVNDGDVPIQSHALPRTSSHADSIGHGSSGGSSIAGDQAGPDSASAADGTRDAAGSSAPSERRTASHDKQSSESDAHRAQPVPPSPLPAELSPEFFEQQSARIMAAIAGTQPVPPSVMPLHRPPCRGSAGHMPIRLRDHHRSSCTVPSSQGWLWYSS